MEEAKDVIRRTLDQAKAFLAQEAPPRLTEADTKANFIEPIVAALGWQGIGVVTREYYVRNSQEFVDYVMAGSSGLLLAIEAKALQVDLTDKHATQLIQYCSVEGIEWAALTNGRELQFFNTFLKPDLSAKRILRLDLLAFNTDDEFDALFAQFWQLSRERMTAPTGVRTWLNQRRLDTTLRTILLNPGSPTLAHLRKLLAASEITASPQDLAQWFRRHLIPPLAAISTGESRQAVSPLKQGSPSVPPAAISHPSTQSLDTSAALRSSTMFADHRPDLLPLVRAVHQDVDLRWNDTVWRELKHYIAAETAGKTFLAIKPRKENLLLGLCLPISLTNPRLTDNVGSSAAFNWSRITKVASVASVSEVDDDLLTLIGAARDRATDLTQGAKYYGITLADLVDSGILPAGTPLVLLRGGTVIARAAIGLEGMLISEGISFRSPSDRTFARLLGNQSLNGWTAWHAELPEGRCRLADLRERLMNPVSATGVNSGHSVA